MNTLRAHSIRATLAPAMAALAALAMSAVGCSRKTASAEAPPQAMQVKMVTARVESVPVTTEYLAQLRSRHSAAINPHVEGYVTHIFVASGDKVTVGQPLMQIDPLRQEATVDSQTATRASKEATLRLAQLQYERAQKLAEAGVISKQDLDNARAALDTAKADLDSLNAQVKQEQVQLHYYKVVAPMNGIIGDIPVRMGDRVTVGTLLTTVDQPGQLEAYIGIPVERSRDLHLGLPVELLNTAGDVVARTQITFLSPEVNPDTQSVLAKATVENPKGDFRTAEVTRARITWSRHEGPVVPLLAVTRINGQYFAFLAESDGKQLVAHQRLIRVGDVIGNDYTVLEGVKPGDRLIVSGAQALADGVPVVEAPAEAAAPTKP
jgi:RND family efflux transporter MFP subunit